MAEDFGSLPLKVRRLFSEEYDIGDGIRRSLRLYGVLGAVSLVLIFVGVSMLSMSGGVMMAAWGCFLGVSGVLVLLFGALISTVGIAMLRIVWEMREHRGV